MVSVSLCGQVRARAGKLFLHNPDGMFEVRPVDEKMRAALLNLTGSKVMIGGSMRTHKAGSYIDLQTCQATEGHHPDRTDHLATLLQVSLGAF